MTQMPCNACCSVHWYVVAGAQTANLLVPSFRSLTGAILVPMAEALDLPLTLMAAPASFAFIAMGLLQPFAMLIADTVSLLAPGP